MLWFVERLLYMRASIETYHIEPILHGPLLWSDRIIKNSYCSFIVHTKNYNQYKKGYYCKRANLF